MKEHKYDNFNPALFAAVPEGARVLDLGCGGGALLQALRDRKGCDAQGLEADAALLKLCRRRGLPVRGHDLEADRALPVKGRFDAVICGDVLEHLRSPETLLRRIRPCLKPEGRLLVSLPNVAFVGVRASLAVGHWDYNPQGGILDSTHLRFYTYKTAAALIQGAGYRIQSQAGLNVVRDRYAFLRVLGRVWPSLFAIQFLIQAQPQGPLAR